MEIKTIPTSVWEFLWGYFSKQKVLFFANLGAIIAGEFLVRLSLYYAAEIVEVISGGGLRDEILKEAVYLAIMASAFLLFKSLVQNCICFIEARFMPTVVATVAKDLFAYAHQHSTAFFAEEMAGNISGKTKTIIDSLYPMYYNLIWGFLTPTVAMLITIAFVLEINIGLAVILLLLNLAVIYVIYRLSKSMVPVSEKRAQTMSEANGVLVDSITNAGLVKNFANYHFEKKHYFKYMKTAAAADRAETKKFGTIFIWQNFFRAFVQVVFYILPIWYWYKGKISVADFVLMQSMIAILSNTFSMLSMNFMQFFKVYGSIRDGLKLLSKPCDVKDISGAVPLKVKSGKIEFSNINYHYKGAKFLFEGFNLTIEPKEKIGLVGRSGSGKSSLIKLLSRYYDIQRGAIYIDGQDISKVTQDSLRRQIALIPQDPSLFNRSIIENIRYGNPKASDEEVFEAARKAYIHDFIIHLPEGYQTKVGERGVMLSGGERQRIAIARAILKNAPILILDEATSALDSESEKYIQESLKELMKDKTVIAIAHRLSTLKEMSKIVVMDKGKIIESGSHGGLLRKKGAYWGFYAMQSSGFIEEDKGE